MAAAVREAAGVDVRVEGPCPGGQVGAAYVRWPGGHRGVLTWRPGTGLAALRDGPLTVAAALRRAGYPAPAVELTVQVRGGVAVVWELLPGAALTLVTHALLGLALALNERQAGALAAHPGVPAFRLFLTGDGPGFCLHQPLREHSARARRLERWVTAVGSGRPDVLGGDDAVHADYQPSNILASGGQVTGVVDWDGAARGDRRLDLAERRAG